MTRIPHRIEHGHSRHTASKSKHKEGHDLLPPNIRGVLTKLNKKIRALEKRIEALEPKQTTSIYGIPIDDKAALEAFAKEHPTIPVMKMVDKYLYSVDKDARKYEHACVREYYDQAPGI